MEYIIDGYNLIKSSFFSKYEKQGIGYSIKVLITTLADYRRKHPSISFTIVFDGNPPPAVISDEKSMKIIFSGEISADEVIRKRVEMSYEENIKRTVVSDDRAVKSAGHLFGAGVMGISDFLEIILPFKKQKGKDKKEEEAKDVNKMRIEKELKRYYGV